MGRSNADRAREAVEQGTWQALAWANLKRPKFVGLIYDAAAKADPTLAAHLARLDEVRGGKEDSVRAALQGVYPGLGAWVVNRMQDRYGMLHLAPLLLRGLDLGEPLWPHIKGTEAEARVRPVLAGSPWPEDRDAAAAWLPEAPEKPAHYGYGSDEVIDRFRMAAGFAVQGDPRGDAALTETLEGLLSNRPHKDDGLPALLTALGQRADSPEAPGWAQAVSAHFDRSLQMAFALIELASGPAGEDGVTRETVVGALHAFMHQRIDDRPRTRARRLAAQAVLAAWGQKPDLDDARWVRTYQRQERYSWATPEMMVALHRLCAEVFLKAGDASERAWAERVGTAQEAETSEAPERPALPLTKGLTVAPLVDDPWRLGEHINGLAISPAGDVLCAVGDGGSQLLDPETGAMRARLATSGWGYDCLFTPDGQQVVVCFHGGHVWVFDAHTGAHLRALEGHPGVPGGVRCMAWAEDGAALITADDQGHLIAWDFAAGTIRWRHEIKGGWSDLVELEDGRVLASYDSQKTRSGTQRHYIMLFETDGQASKPIKSPIEHAPAVWGIARHPDGRIAMGGGGGQVAIGRVKGKRFKPEMEVAFPSDITRLEWVGDALWGVATSGAVSRVDLTEGATKGEPEAVEIARSPAALWGLTHHAGVTFAAGKAGQVIRIEGLNAPPVAVTHQKRVVGALELSDGTLITLDWDGVLLRWPGGAGPGEQVIALDATGEWAALVDDHTALCGTRKGLRLVDLSAGEVLAEAEDGVGSVALLADGQCVYGTKRGLQRATLPDLKPVGDPMTARADRAGLAATPDGTGLLVSPGSSGALGLWRDGDWQWIRHDNGADRLEEGNPHKEVVSVQASPDGRYAVTGAFDDTARVYRLEEGALVWRIECGFSLFNRLSISADSRLLALPSSPMVEVWDLESGQLAWRLNSEATGGQSICGTYWLSDGCLLVTTDPGGLYVVSR